VIPGTDLTGPPTYDGPVMPPSFDSYSQNGEDVVLTRALAGVRNGRYVDVGANHPRDDSVSMAFYLRGWTGITVEPDPEFAQLQREQRPRDLQVEAAATNHDGETVILHVVDGTGLSTLDAAFAQMHKGSGYTTHEVTVPARRLDRVLEEAGWAGQDIHFLAVDTEGSERQVLEGIDLSVWRPWILVIEATAPNQTESMRQTWEHLVTGADYRFCLFDGLSCFYVAAEHSAQLGEALGYPACILDNYTTLAFRQCTKREQQLRPLIDDVVRWRTQAVTRWATAVANEALVDDLRTEMQGLRDKYQQLGAQHHLLNEQAGGMHRQITEYQQSTSWRVTRPLRAASGALSRLRLRPSR
jgi:FkbM family methyltransferase